MFESEGMHKVLAGILIFYLGILCIESLHIFSDRINLFQTIDSTICAIFIVELVARIAVSGLKFFKNGWNVFDFIVILASAFASGGIAAFRCLRVFRVAEMMNISRHTRIIINSITRSLPILLHVFMALAILFLLFAIAAFDLFGASAPQLFGNLRESAYTLMMILISDKVVEAIEAVSPTHPYGYLFFLSYIIIISFIVLNLFFGVIIDSLQRAIDQEEKK